MNDKHKIIAKIRAFNRFYTDLIGLMDRHFLYSDYSLAEARILYEIHTCQLVQASQTMAAMQIDKSYLSRLLKKLEKGGLIMKKASNLDARASLLSLTPKGKQIFDTIVRASDDQIEKLIKILPASQELVSHMQFVSSILSNTNIKL